MIHVCIRLRLTNCSSRADPLQNLIPLQNPCLLYLPSVHQFLNHFLLFFRCFCCFTQLLYFGAKFLHSALQYIHAFHFSLAILASSCIHDAAPVSPSVLPSSPPFVDQNLFQHLQQPTTLIARHQKAKHPSSFPNFSLYFPVARLHSCFPLALYTPKSSLIVRL